MNKELLIEKYANLLVESGVNLQKGQPLNVNTSTDVECIEFVRKLVEVAYKKGASYVKVNYRDGYITKLNINSQSNEVLENIPDYKIDEIKYDQSNNICNIGITSFDPDAMKGLNPKKYQQYQRVLERKAGRELLNYYGSNKGQWCVAGFPTKKWAKVIYPKLDENEAYDKLFLDIMNTVMIDEYNDPIEEWYKHNKTIRTNCDKLNLFNLKELHYSNSLGTNLIIKLPIGHIWCGGDEYTNNEKKILFNPNMPTEEVFTSPLKDGIDGIVYATKPLISGGNLIDNFWIKFNKGKIVDYDAKVGKEYLKAIIESDEGSRYLGEVALVPYHSPISTSNILFYSTLYDENASCHLAIGDSYPTTVKGTEGLNEDQLHKIGLNTSLVHVDFMVGSKDMEIIGITQDNQKVQIFKNGDFAI